MIGHFSRCHKASLSPPVHISKRKLFSNYGQFYFFAVAVLGFRKLLRPRTIFNAECTWNSNCFICWFCSSFLIEASSPFSAVANGDVVKSVAASNTSLTAHENHQPRIICNPLWSSFSCSLACATNFRESSSIMWLMKDFPLSWTTSDSDSMQIDTNHLIFTFVRLRNNQLMVLKKIGVKVTKVECIMSPAAVSAACFCVPL